MISDLTELAPGVRAEARRWLDASVVPLGRAIRASVREDLAAELCARLEPGSTLEDLGRVTTAIGPPATDDAPTGGHDGKVPLGSRIARRWWDPVSPRVFVRRAVGIGWDVNFGAVAVRLGLIEPDAEDVPFDSTPESAFRAAGVVTALTGATALATCLLPSSRRPSHVPNHWNWRGEPDRWVARRRATLLDSGLAVAGVSLALRAAAGSGRGAARAGELAAASVLTGLALGMVGMRRAGSARLPWAAPALTATVLAGPAVSLFGLARAGRAAERDRDLAAGVSGA